MRKLICRYCKEKDIKDNMECEETVTSKGTIKRAYFHKGECWEEHLKQKELSALDDAKVMCRHCNGKDLKENMEYEETIYSNGTVKRAYFHKGKCWDDHLERKAFLAQERAELDRLDEVIKQVHKIDRVPKQFYPFLQELRNGSVMIGKKVKKYKEGFSYDLIADTYLYCADSIKWAKDSKVFDSTMNELRYCRSIVLDKIYFVKKKKEKELQKTEIAQAREEKRNKEALEVHEDRKVAYVKKKHKKDISRFLD